MTAVRPEDIEPEEQRARGSADWRRDANFRWPERVPWSELSPAFIEHWSPPTTKNNREHLEIVGPSGSGKTHLLLTMLQDHYRSEEAYRAQNDRKHIGTRAILLVTKQDDDVFRRLGWPVVHSVDEIRDTNVIVWPRTKKVGTARSEFHEARVRSLLHELWQPKANAVLAFDEVGYVESLSGEIRTTMQHYWREGRSMGIQIVGMKQRPQGALRDMHSETFWTAVFRPKDRSDAERFAELLGHRRDWVPVLDDLSLDDHEFVLRHSRSDEAYISWVDTPLKPQKIRRRGEVGGYPR